MSGDGRAIADKVMTTVLVVGTYLCLVGVIVAILGAVAWAALTAWGAVL